MEYRHILLARSIRTVLGCLAEVISLNDPLGNMNSMLAAIFRNLEYQNYRYPTLFGYLPEVSGYSDYSD
jgi:hypothetical protein